MPTPAKYATTKEAQLEDAMRRDRENAQVQICIFEVVEESKPYNVEMLVREVRKKLEAVEPQKIINNCKLLIKEELIAYKNNCFIVEAPKVNPREKQEW